MTAICQSDTRSNSIDIYFNPVNVRLGNLNNQRIIVDHDRIDINYNKFVTQEVGVRFNHKLKETHLSFLCSTNFKQFKYGYSLTIDGGSNFNSNVDNFVFNRIRSVGLIGLKFGVSILAFESTSVSLSMETNWTINYGSITNQLQANKSYFYFHGNSSQVISETKLNITEQIRGLNDPLSYFIPELNFQTQLWRNFRINYGLKYKFWGKENFIDIQVKGYYDTPSDPETILFESKVNNSQMITYFGLAYTFGLGKKDKQE
jgi:hypothetical protein